MILGLDIYVRFGLLTLINIDIVSLALFCCGFAIIVLEAYSLWNGLVLVLSQGGVCQQKHGKLCRILLVYTFRMLRVVLLLLMDRAWLLLLFIWNLGVKSLILLL